MSVGHNVECPEEFLSSLYFFWIMYVGTLFQMIPNHCSFPMTIVNIFDATLYGHSVAWHEDYDNLQQIIIHKQNLAGPLDNHKINGSTTTSMLASLKRNSSRFFIGFQKKFKLKTDSASTQLLSVPNVLYICTETTARRKPHPVLFAYVLPYLSLWPDFSKIEKIIDPEPKAYHKQRINLMKKQR